MCEKKKQETKSMLQKNTVNEGHGYASILKPKLDIFLHMENNIHSLCLKGVKDHIVSSTLRGKKGLREKLLIIYLSQMSLSVTCLLKGKSKVLMHVGEIQACTFKVHLFTHAQTSHICSTSRLCVSVLA